MMKDIKVIAFDADDTLWDNEIYFKEATEKFSDLVKNYLPAHISSEELLKVEIKNLPLYGYGIKGFTLSMIETIIKITENNFDSSLINGAIDICKNLIQKPVNVFNDVQNVLDRLSKKYILAMATKGDLLDQKRKLEKSGLKKYFSHIEIMSDKKASDYGEILKKLNCEPKSFLMVGNSLKSDIVPVLELGANAVYIPFQVVWSHEKIDYKIEDPNFYQIDKISELENLLV